MRVDRPPQPLRVDVLVVPEQAIELRTGLYVLPGEIYPVRIYELSRLDVDGNVVVEYDRAEDGSSGRRVLPLDSHELVASRLVLP